MKTKVKAVIFDFDGVLADSMESIIRMFKRTFTESGQAAPSAPAITALIGHTTLEIIVTLLPAGKKDDKELVERMRVNARRIAMEEIESVKAHRGAVETVKWLREKGIKTAIVTNRGRKSTEKALENFGIQNDFDIIIASGDVGKGKPDPEGIFMALGKLDARPEEVIYVGDMSVDAKAGAAAGVKTLIVGKGKDIESLLELEKIAVS
ncbi:Phosphoglycolate phosphatase [Candidatus Gugararchaeum adminiculabundum]|nr:Phosphoglycolate phosphatase [Candidatus Gugararchaeum adminiculabundum]